MYTAINKKLYFVAWATSLLVALSCSREEEPSRVEPASSKYEIVVGTGERVRLELVGKTDFSAFALQDDVARYALSTKPSEPRTAPLINLDAQVGEGKARKMLVRLVNREEPSKITEVIVGPDELLFEGKEGEYSFKLNLEVNLQEGQSFSSGEWYLSAIYNSTNTDDPSVFVHNPTDAKFFTTAASRVEMPGVSLVIPWTRVYTKASPSSDDKEQDIKKGVGAAVMGQLSPQLGRNLSLRLKPDGVMLRVRPVSNVIEDILITRIRLRTQELVMGTHSYKKPTVVSVDDLTNGAFPEVTSVSSTAEVDLGHYDKSQADVRHTPGYVLPSGDYGRLEMLVWGFPKVGAESDPNLGTYAWVEARGYLSKRAADGTIWSSQTQVIDDGTSDGTIVNRAEADVRFFSNGNNQGIQAQYVSERWGERVLYQKIKKQTLKRGSLYLILPRVESDLQITERYSLLQDPSTGRRYGVIEIHNPTLRDIDLNEYGLTRIAVTGYESSTHPTLGAYGRGATTGFDTSRFTNLNIGEMYAFPQVEANKRINSDDFMNTSTPFQNLDAFAKALVLPFSSKYRSATLGMTAQGSAAMFPFYKVNKDKQPTNELRDDVPRTEVLGSTESADYTASYVDYTTLLGGAEPYSIDGTRANILSPGQTMVILSNGYLESDKFTDNTSNQTTDNIPTFFADIRKGVATGFCKYVVAMNNARREDARPLDADAGVLTLGSYDIPVLVKRKQRPNLSSGYYYQLLDGLWTNAPLASYLGYASSGSTTEQIYQAQLSANENYGIVSQYIKAKARKERTGEHTGVWEKRTPSLLFNTPFTSDFATGRMVAAQDFALGQTDNFTNFGVRLFQDQITARRPDSYVVRWSTAKAK